ncbi:hypothetical protein [Pantanalinema sp. GBBB05]|uniref:hypothetical protein n=1 Tax=Pantanalinema sp. GBBB05 TaxID=2604139 RepID=UPI001D7D020F|nr:hypothetical protein [Pantanalinema sp. GBBB05]
MSSVDRFSTLRSTFWTKNDSISPIVIIRRDQGFFDEKVGHPSRDKAMPNDELTDRAIIEEFIESVSWGNDCFLVESVASGRTYLLTNHYVLVPCHYKQFEAVAESIQGLAKQLYTKPGAILYSDHDHLEYDRITWTARRLEIAVYWLE